MQYFCGYPGYDDGNNGSDKGGNSGTMIVDATYAPSNIRFPQNVSLLNKPSENAEKLGYLRRDLDVIERKIGLGGSVVQAADRTSEYATHHLPIVEVHVRQPDAQRFGSHCQCQPAICSPNSLQKSR